ncbi:YdcF family protein [Candidatus Woesearchaeota archaeon]|nr:YdcF family protein [Candidatus Woesearchaeota archaeon]
MKYDAIICLGKYPKAEKDKETGILRAKKAVELFKKKAANKIIFTGGFHHKKGSEAAFMQHYALKSGIKSKDIIVEKHANTTVQNAEKSMRIMHKMGMKSAIVVTSPQHILRAKYVFNKLGKNKEFTFIASKNNLNALQMAKAIIYELSIFIKYIITGKLK